MVVKIEITYKLFQDKYICLTYYLFNIYYVHITIHVHTQLFV